MREEAQFVRSLLESAFYFRHISHSVCPSVSMYKRGSVKFYIGDFYENLSRK
jgi:hypothetical protein